MLQMNIGLFKNNEIGGSVDGAAQAKMHSPLFGVFILSWAAVHWQSIYVAFFVSEDLIFKKYGVLRNEYITERFLNFHHLSFYIGWIAPIVITVLVIWVVPDRIGIHAFKADEKYKTKKKRFVIQEAARLEVERKKLEKASTSRLKATTERAKSRKKLAKVDPAAAWDEEFKLFQKSPLYGSFQEVINSVYKFGGRIRPSYATDQWQGIPQDMLVFADTSGLVHIDTAGASRKIALTDKGKHFVSLYSSSKLENRPLISGFGDIS